MQGAPSSPLSEPIDTARMSEAQLLSLVQSQVQTIASLERQLDWFRRQLFGQKSERFAPEPDPKQLALGEIAASSGPTEKRKSVAAHTRRVRERDAAGEELAFFDESRVPVQTVVLMPEHVRGLSADDYEIIGEKVSYRLAQLPGSYRVLKYTRPIVKLKASEAILTVPAPAGIFDDHSRADVSFAAGVLLDKFAWHLPLYRQHQRLEAAGIRVTRPWLTQLTQRSVRLLAPIYDAQLASIRAGRVKAMDETPIKAGRSGHGKMRTGYFWPIYGELDEVCFPFHPSRSADFVSAALGLQSKDSVLLTDGYAAYERYAKKTGLTHAQCWAHCRRGFFEALQAEPTLAAEALKQIKLLYGIEEQIRQGKLSGEAKQLHRLTHAKPIVEYFFDWVDRQLQRQGLLPSSPLTQALAYARERRMGLEVFLSDPDVPIDTNHLERALRVIAVGRKSWLFCWTELGAQHVGIIQSLIATCRLQSIDPHTYLVDVLQRVGTHPASRVAELTPRLWKQQFAASPLRSDIHDFPR
jgi:transposase